MILTVKLFGQQFSQYNTGTLYDSFENPSQRSFIPDSSRSLASNFFIPNLSGSFFVKGNAQNALMSRFFSAYYNTGALEIGNGKYSMIRSNSNVYLGMLKIFTSLNGNQELGFSISSRSETSGHITDESIALFNGSTDFKNDTYNNVFNSKLSYQLYNQFSLSYREQVTPRLALGVKLSALLGMAYRQINIVQSRIVFDRDNEAAILSLQGFTRASDSLKVFTLKNPGMAISIGAGYTNRDGFRFQYNLKDLGVIHWGGEAYQAAFDNGANGGTIINGLKSAKREDNIINAASNITSANKTGKNFYSKTNAIAEVSVNKTYWLDYDHRFKLSPTLIASKELFYNGVTGAAVVPFGYNNHTATVTASYNTIGMFNFGAQYMFKTPNAEFFIGTERLLPSARTARMALNGNETQRQTTGVANQYSGADFFIGASFKFGNVIEHPMNASFIPDGGERGFFGRMWDKIFKGKDKNY